MPEQRRLVTVLFADVVGSTALAEELDAEDVRALFTRYYALANEVVTSHGGIVAKLLGDGVLACFGVPTAHGDDAQRALDAALALRDAVARDAALQRLQLRIGVNTGEVLANEDASGEIVGDAVNIAARVAAAAGEGEVLAADATHRAASGIAYGDAREIAAKGKSQPVRVWPVQGRAAASDSPTPFVGREEDLAQLELVARRAFRDRRPHLVTITAAAGAGKSRLAHEFRARLGQDAAFARASCPPYGETLAYGPLRGLLTDLIGVPRDAPPDEVRRRLGAVLEGPEAERDATLVALTVAPEGTPGDQDRDRVIGAWRRLIARLASPRKILIVLEDLQNASDSLLDLVEQIAQPTLEAPLVLVCLARPELLQRRSTWGGGRRNTLNLSLEPLGDEDIAALIARQLEAEPPDALRDLVVERAAGNPFFAEELVRALLERGPIDLSDPEMITRALRALPETVQATLLARIDMLRPGERGALQAAAVAGRTFGASALGVISELPASELAAALDALLERELISRTGDDEYAFRNALIRDVAYGMLPRARRARDHARIARHIEATAGDRVEELAGLVGTHYLEATRLRRMSAVRVSADEAEDEAVRLGAVHWLPRASRANLAASAWTEAITQLQDAASVATDEERVGVLTQLGEAATGGDLAWDALTEALRLWRAGRADPGAGARVIVATLITLFRSGVSIAPERLPEVAEQDRLANEALDLARKSGDELILAAAQVTHAYLARVRDGRTTTSLEAARDEAIHAAAILERHGSLRLWSIALDACAAIVGDLGDLAGADEIAMRRLARRESVPGIERAHAHWTIPIYAMALGDIERARANVEAALSEPSFVSSRWVQSLVVGEVFLTSWRAATWWALGAWDAAIADARDEISRTIPRLADGPMRRLFRDAGCAALYAARRREDEALAQEVSPLLRRWCDDERSLALLDDDPTHLDVALERVETAGIDVWQVERSVSLLAAYGRVPVSRARLDELIAWAEPRKLRPLVAQLLRLRARSGGSADDARRAHHILVECGLHADAALAGIEVAALGDRSLLARARVELERRGDRLGLAAADALG